MKIVIVDDDCLVTGALKTILEANEDVDVVATGLDGRDAVRLYGEHKPDVLLMDIRMKNMNGLEAATEILYAYPEANILLLTTFLDDEYIVTPHRSKGISFETGLCKHFAGTPGGLFGADGLWNGNCVKNPRFDKK